MEPRAWKKALDLLAAIAAILGHKTLAMVQRYSHLSDGHLRSTLAKMTAAL
jgi:site-specific recombinase XerD